jgi:hypothetical protein
MGLSRDPRLGRPTERASALDFLGGTVTGAVEGVSEGLMGEVVLSGSQVAPHQLDVVRFRPVFW